MRVNSSRAGGRRAGAVIIETTVVLIIFFLFMFGVMEFGRLVMAYHLTTNSAREGARVAVVLRIHDTTDSAEIAVKTQQIKDAASARLVGQLAGATVQVYRADLNTGANLGSDWYAAKFGEGIGIQVSGAHTTILPSLLGLPASVTVSSTSVMRSEAN